MVADRTPLKGKPGHLPPGERYAVSSDSNSVGRILFHSAANVHSRVPVRASPTGGLQGYASEQRLAFSAAAHIWCNRLVFGLEPILILGLADLDHASSRQQLRRARLR
jgi:hypothetical protein